MIEDDTDDDSAGGGARQASLEVASRAEAEVLRLMEQRLAGRLGVEADGLPGVRRDRLAPLSYAGKSGEGASPFAALLNRPAVEIAVPGAGAATAITPSSLLRLGIAGASVERWSDGEGITLFVPDTFAERALAVLWAQGLTDAVRLRSPQR